MMVVMVNNKSTGSCSRSCKSLTVSFFSANALPYPKVSLLPTAVEVTRDLNFGIESKQECVSSENSSDRFLSVSCFWLSCLLLLALASPRWNIPQCNICCLLKRLRGLDFFSSSGAFQATRLFKPSVCGWSNSHESLCHCIRLNVPLQTLMPSGDGNYSTSVLKLYLWMFIPRHTSPGAVKYTFKPFWEMDSSDTAVRQCGGKCIADFLEK